MSIAAISAPRQRQGELGQFFTPAPVADFMASLFGPLPNVVRLLDAGAGTGALTAAFVSRLCEKNEGVRAVEATLYELDPRIQDALSETMQNCQRVCAQAGIQFTFAIHATDFIHEMSARLAKDLFGKPPPTFDAAIANPPYRKISMDSLERRNLRYAGVETSNLYTGFIALIQRLLVPGGQLVGITPRSFCNGPYFRNFREEFLGNLEVHRLHVFESREAAFRDDSVLQENIIFHAVRGRKQPREIVISSSSGENGDTVAEKVVTFTDVVHPHDAEKFIHSVVSLRISSRVLLFSFIAVVREAAPHPLCPLIKAARPNILQPVQTNIIVNVTVCHVTFLDVAGDASTGSVREIVSFRQHVRVWPQKPLAVKMNHMVRVCHFNGGTVHWPKPGARKPNSILNNDAILGFDGVSPYQSSFRGLRPSWCSPPPLLFGATTDWIELGFGRVSPYPLSLRALRPS